MKKITLLCFVVLTSFALLSCSKDKNGPVTGIDGPFSSSNSLSGKMNGEVFS